MLTEFDAAGFRFKADLTIVPDVDMQWFSETLRQMVANGERFGDGETIQLGWGLLEVRRNADGSLNLLEPDYANMPMEWIDTVTQTIRDLRLQKDVCESLFDIAHADFPSLRHHCITCSRLKDAGRVTMERFAATPPDSGWFIGCGDAAHDHDSPAQLSRTSLYEAILSNQRARMFLALPVGTLLEADDEDIHIYYRGKPVNAKQGSYVAKLKSMKEPE